MSYAAALDHLYSLGLELVSPPTQPGAPPPPPRKFELAHMRALAAALGDPQLSFPAILIAGTNGKGSTAATLSSIFTAAGYRTALYTSPHLVRVNERIQIDAHQIPDEDFARLYFHVVAAAHALVDAGTLPHLPSFFEVLTALAFAWFAEQRVDIAILEVGLGGTLDATNIVEPILSILTDIALDHQEYLGNTISAIAREKCGILRPNGLLVTLPQHPEANQAIGEVAATLNLRAISATQFIPHTPDAGAATAASHLASEIWSEAPHLPPNQYTLILDDAPLEVDSPLPGHHQQRNIALAIAAAVTIRNQSSVNFYQTSHPSSYKISNANIEAGIRNTQWPGRLEFLTPRQGPPILVDVAHNPAGAWSLRAAIAHLPDALPRTLIFSCLRDKSLAEMSKILFPLFDSTSFDPARNLDHIILVPIDNPRAADVQHLLAAAHNLDIPAHASPHLTAALAQARSLTPPDGLIIATGSVYLIGELRQLLAEQAG